MVKLKDKILSVEKLNTILQSVAYMQKYFRDNTVNLVTTLKEDITVFCENKKTEISNYLSGDAIKKSYISYAKIGGCILAVDGVDDYANLKVNGTAANISIPAGSVPVLGSVVIT